MRLVLGGRTHSLPGQEALRARPTARRACLAVVSAMFLAVFATTPTAADEPADGFFYESLSLHTPADAVEQFTYSFAQRDFVTTYFVLANDARSEITRAIQMLRTDRFVEPDAMDVWPGFRSGSEQGYSDSVFLYAEIMEAAVEAGALYIDFTKTVEVPDGEARRAARAGQSGNVTVTAPVQGRETPVDFILERSPSARWRLLAVRFPDADGDRYWPAPPDDD